MSSFALNLAALCHGMPGLTPHAGGALAEAAAVCLEHNSHLSGVECQLTGYAPGTTTLDWGVVDDLQRATHADLQEATEHGAAGVAILAAQALVGLTVQQRAAKGTGVDYWLGAPGMGNDQAPFQDLTRLEASGILTGNAIAVNRRVAIKLVQTEPTDHICPVYVIVVEFGTPMIHVEEK